MNYLMEKNIRKKRRTDKSDEEKLVEIENAIELLKDKLEETEKVYKELNDKIQFKTNTDIWKEVLTIEWAQKKSLQKLLPTLYIKKLFISIFFDVENRIPGDRQIYDGIFAFTYSAKKKKKKTLLIQINGNVCVNNIEKEGKTNILLSNGMDVYDLCIITTKKNDIDMIAEEFDLQLEDLFILIQYIQFVYLCNTNHIPVHFIADNTSLWDQYVNGLIEFNKILF